MGQSQSGETHQASTEQLSHELALKFAKRCFSPLELYSFQDVFKSLADHQESISYLKEDTMARFLEIPDILGVSPILFQMMSYLGAFPFVQTGPAILGFEQMIMVVVIMTERYRRVLKNGNRDRTKLLFRSLAIFDRSISSNADPKDTANPEPEQSRSHAPGFAVDAGIEDEDEYDDDDEIALAALESLDSIGVFRHGDQDHSAEQAAIPADNLKKFIMLLLLISPLDAQENLSKYQNRLTGESLENLRRVADCILAAFLNVEKYPGVKLKKFSAVIPTSLPFIFNGVNPLFEHFLFSKKVDFTKRKDSATPEPSTSQSDNQPLLPKEGEIMDVNVLSQLSFFLPGTSIFRNLKLLYSGGDAGFSMGSFETRVFNWKAPTILLVAGTRILATPEGTQEKAFSDKIGPKRFPDSSDSSRLVFGVYVSQPWKQTFKECLGDSNTLLFQLEPHHEVFRPSSVNRDYVSLVPHAGLGVGSPLPKSKIVAGLDSHAVLGTVSLFLDASFEFGAFTHNETAGGGAFKASQTRQFNFQDRFEIESLEVWGCGGDTESKAQRERWAWEEKEAEARRRINLGSGDIEADRALLEMAGIIGNNRSGGSMG